MRGAARHVAPSTASSTTASPGRSAARSSAKLRLVAVIERAGTPGRSHWGGVGREVARGSEAHDTDARRTREHGHGGNEVVVRDSLRQRGHGSDPPVDQVKDGVGGLVVPR